MKIGFNPKNEITNISELFGREREMQFLIGYAKRRSCVQVIGPRRFGKTSLLKCLESHFNKIDDSDIYPLYIDFTEVALDFPSTANVYRYLISLVVSKISSEKLFDSVEQFRGVSISPSIYWEDTYDALENTSRTRLPEVLKDVLLFFSELIEKTFLFLFDEYEYLFKYGFDKPTGFTTLRNFSSRLNNNGRNPFIFFVAGVLTWEKLCTLTKSGELNVIDGIVRVTPIQQDDFKKMWVHESTFLENPAKELNEGLDFAFKASGGVPFYAKAIGNYWFLNRTKPTFNILQAHFNEILNSLEIEQKDVLVSLLKGNISLRETENVLELRANGLITKRKNIYEHTIQFLKEYLLSINAQPNFKDIELPMSFKLTDQITDYIANINSTCFNKGKEPIFDVLNEDESLYRDLRTPMQDRNQAVQFSSSLYRILYEKTKVNNVSKAKLPNVIANGDFVALVDIMRHSLGKGHLIEKFQIRPNQMTPGQMYKKLPHIRILTSTT
jgi:AAA+ ATPase superfamily predicted ATPase